MEVTKQVDIPEDLKERYQFLCSVPVEIGLSIREQKEKELIERVGRAEANIARRKEVAMKVTKMYQRLDKHDTKLEDALKSIAASDDVWKMLAIARAALTPNT